MQGENAAYVTGDKKTLAYITISSIHILNLEEFLEKPNTPAWSGCHPNLFDMVISLIDVRGTRLIILSLVIFSPRI